MPPEPHGKKALLFALPLTGRKLDWLNDHFVTFGTLDTLPDGWQAGGLTSARSAGSR